MIDEKMYQQKIEKFAKERDWGQFHSPKNLVMALAIEASELMEPFQWMTEDVSRESWKDEKFRLKIQEEVADVMTYLLRLSDLMKIDLNEALTDKHKKNALKYPVERCKGSARKYNEE